ncbi:MAG: protein kinase, partial [Anaerolineae bacterium]|nr:protein kinase [Anaerolineae bacterium]
MTNHDAPLVGGRYLRQQKLGQGGMGIVYRGLDIQTQQPVAIKSLRPELNLSSQILKRFMREGEVLRQLDHPNIVKMLAMVEQDGAHYLIMEYVGGGTLRDLLNQQPQLPVEKVLGVGLDLSDALARAHRLSIIHRDLKPSNIMFTGEGIPCLTDFSIAQLEGPDITEPGSLVGTPPYLSPEACNGEPVDARGDIWSLGIVLFEMLTGHHPFRCGNPAATITAILTRPLPDMLLLRPDAPQRLVNLIYAMLEKARARRIPSARLVGAELEAIMYKTDTGSWIPLELGGIDEVESTLLKNPPPGLPAAAPVLPPIPAPPVLLVGRSAIKAAIHKGLDGGGRVSLHGMGGMGKTALAATVAYERKENHGEKVLWVMVGQRGDWSAVYDDIGRIFDNRAVAGLEPDAKPAHTRTILDRQKINLIVLDDVWDGAPVRRFERDALPAGCALLVTGRERIGVGRAHDVMHLNDQDSAALFRYHAGLPNYADVRQVCTLLDGHPMAIEIAGRMMSIDGLSLDVLCDRLKNAGERARTLKLSEAERENVSAVLQTSYEILSAGERSVFRSFGALWTTTATAELLAPVARLNERAAEDALTGLVRHSL